MPKFVKGRSGNPLGLPKVFSVVRKLCRAQTEANIKALIAIRDDDEAPHAARIAAINALLARGLAKPKRKVRSDKNIPRKNALHDARTTLGAKLDRISTSKSKT